MTLLFFTFFSFRFKKTRDGICSALRLLSMELDIKTLLDHQPRWNSLREVWMKRMWLLTLNPSLDIRLIQHFFSIHPTSQHPLKCHVIRPGRQNDFEFVVIVISFYISSFWKWKEKKRNREHPLLYYVLELTSTIWK